MKTAIFNTQYYEKELFEQQNKAGHELLFFNEPLTATTAARAVGCTAVSILVHDRADEPAIRALAEAGVRLITLRAAGYDNVDLQAAARYGVTVARVPAYSPEAVAEHAVALLLACTRKLHRAHQRVKQQNFSLINLMGGNIYGKKVGVIGTGRIGSAFCRIMMGFGCSIQAFDKVENPELTGLGVTYVSLDELLADSDIISLHCPLTPVTQHMIDGSAIKKMRSGAILINTARGAVVNTADLISFLQNGHIGAYGADVYEGEAQLFFRDLTESCITDVQFLELSSFPNVLITPHQAYFTKEAVTQIIAVTLANLSEFEAGKLIENVVTAQL